jgi:hypothetical protein
MRHVAYTCVIALSLMLLTCGGSGSSGGGSVSSNRTPVIINLGDRAVSADDVSTQTIPPDVCTIVILITAPDMAPIEVTLNVEGLESVMVTIDVPNGVNRLVEVFALNCEGILLYEGSTFIPVIPVVEGMPMSIEVAVFSADDTPPVFGGIEDAIALSSSTAELLWSSAVDDITPPGDMTYLIFLSLVSGGQNFDHPTRVVTGATSIILDQLEPATTYFAVVRARDAEGNEDDNLVELDFTTLPVSDTTPPDFDGIQSAAALSQTSIALGWNPATDPDDIMPSFERAVEATPSEDKPHTHNSPWGYFL